MIGKLTPGNWTRERWRNQIFQILLLNWVKIRLLSRGLIQSGGKINSKIKKKKKYNLTRTNFQISQFRVQKGLRFFYFFTLSFFCFFLSFALLNDFFSFSTSFGGSPRVMLFKYESSFIRAAGPPLLITKKKNVI